MTHVYLDTRRLLALGTLLLASFLQICGCNPVPDCRGILQLQLSSLASAGLRERCAQCVTPQQMTSLVRAPGRLLFAGTGARPRSEATIQQALLGGEDISFHNPGGDEASSVENGPAGSDYSPLLRPAASSDARFAPWPIMESVFFVYRSVETGNEVQQRVPIATAFILSVPDVNHRTLARFLVTARHIVDPEWAHCSNQNPASLEVGLNRRSGGVGYETISLDKTRRPSYFVPADSTSDIAIIRLDEHLIPDLESYKLVDTPFRLLPTPADLHALTGAQQIVTASLRAQEQADLSAFPASGRGALSSSLGETVDTYCGSNPTPRSLDVWFIGGSVQQGVSGAPVYTSLVRDGQTAPTTILLGVQAIAWPDRGVAGMTPSTALANLVQTALGSQRERADFYRGVTP